MDRVNYALGNLSTDGHTTRRTKRTKVEVCLVDKTLNHCAFIFVAHTTCTHDTSANNPALINRLPKYALGQAMTQPSSGVNHNDPASCTAANQSRHTTLMPYRGANPKQLSSCSQSTSMRRTHHWRCQVAVVQLQPKQQLQPNRLQLPRPQLQAMLPLPQPQQEHRASWG